MHTTNQGGLEHDTESTKSSNCFAVDEDEGEPGIGRTPVLVALFTCVSVVMALCLMVACSDSGPSVADVEQLVRAQLQVLVPPFIVRAMNSQAFEGKQSGKDAMVEEIRVIRISRVRTKYPYREYWSVKVYVEGKCTMTYSGTKREFAGEVRYDVHKNSGGQWALR